MDYCTISFEQGNKIFLTKKNDTDVILYVFWLI